MSLAVTKELTPETIRSTDGSGRKAWTYNGALFVSGAVKERLETLSGGTLHFGRGFEWWG